MMLLKRALVSTARCRTTAPSCFAASLRQFATKTRPVLRSKKALGGVAVQTAIGKLREDAKANFDESVDVAVHLNVDTRKSDQNVRGSVELPHGTGRAVTVAVFAKDAKAEEALAAGADFVGKFFTLLVVVWCVVCGVCVCVCVCACACVCVRVCV